MGLRGKGRIGSVAAPSMALASACFAATPTFHSGITTGNIQNANVTEASGIAVSRLNPNVLWTHDDSGSGAQVYPMTPAGVSLGNYTITGAGATDWEDIAVGPGPTAGAQYLYIADIGDNLAVRSTVSVYRVPEPLVSDTQPSMNVSVGGMNKLTFAYPNGPHDAESMFVDPLTRDIYIVSKREANKYVYRAPYPQATSGTTTMTLVSTLSNSDWITAADISPDGDEIIMRAGAIDTGLMYVRPAGGTIADAFASTPINIPLLAEAQGEAIGFDPQGWGYFTTTEGASAPIRYFNRFPPPAGIMYWDNDGVAAGSRTTGAGLGGTGTWNTSALKWYTGSAEVAWQNGNHAVFGGAAGTVTLGSPIAANTLAFKTTGYIITGSTLTLGGPINVDPNVHATINSSLAGAASTVSVASGGKFTLGGSNVVLKTGSITTNGSGKLDVKNNKLVVTAQALGSWTGSAYTGVTGLIQSGRGDGHWAGGGIVTSMADATTSLRKTLAVMTADANGAFGGVSVSAGNVLVMYTWGGDANLDGLLDGDDYFAIDSHVLNSGFVFGFHNGDFDYNGAIDGDDYFIIDSNITFAQSASRGVAPVPEPAGVAILLGIPRFLSRRRK
jgi:hypothetical protein